MSRSRLAESRSYVTECTADNIFIVKNGTLLTPAPHYGALDGITRMTVLNIAPSCGITSLETALTATISIPPMNVS